MAKRPGHPSSRGVLTRLAKGQPSRRAPSTLPRKVLSWAAQGLIGIALLALIALVLFAMFRPTLGEQILEGDFKIEEVRDGTAAFPPEQMAVAEAVVHIQKKRVLLPVTAEQRRGLTPGREVHVRYAYFPRLNRVRVDSWSPK